MWLLQRASALYMAAFLLVFLMLFLAAGPMDFATWHALFAPMVVKVGTLLFVAALLVHAWIGLREIFIDYVHFLVPRLALYLAFAVLYLGCLIWTLDILWSVK
jgi:succinate dehydrogenase / fumarate reductase membrane anchor subunit